MSRLNFQKHCVLLSALLGVALASSLPAATIIYTGGDVSAIDGLIVDGHEYNVTFNAFVPNYTFLNNESGANDAVNAINVLLNGPAWQNGVFWITDPPYGSQYFEVSYAIASASQNDAILGNLTTQWIDQGPTQSTPNNSLIDNDYAQFTLVPEPSSPALLIVGLLAVPALRKLRKRS